MSVLEIQTILMFGDNYAYMLVCPETREAAVVDPGTTQPVLDFLAGKDMKLSKVLCTHHHGDHTGGCESLKQKTGCKIIASTKDSGRISGVDETVAEGDGVTVGDLELRVLETPGHTRGHVVFYSRESEALFSGDAFFSAGCGRLFEGDAEDMHLALQKISLLPESTRVYCGHEYTQKNIAFALTVEPGNSDLVKYRDRVDALRREQRPTVPSTIGLEKKINPFLRCASSEIRKKTGKIGAPEIEVFAELRRRKDRF